MFGAAKPVEVGGEASKLEVAVFFPCLGSLYSSICRLPRDVHASLVQQHPKCITVLLCVCTLHYLVSIQNPSLLTLDTGNPKQ